MSNLLLGRIAVPKTALFVCDIQEKFSKNIKYFPQVVENTRKLLQASKIMNIPVVYTEQYPKGNSANFKVLIHAFRF
jgi:isochorismate hydrolase